MKIIKIIACALLASLSIDVYTQELQWVNFIEKTHYLSEVHSVDITSNGDYLIYAYQEKEFIYGKTYFIKYNNAGEVVVEDSLAANQFLFDLNLFETNDGSHWFIRKNGEIYRKESTTDSLSLLYNFNTNGQTITLTKAKKHHNNIWLTATNQETQKGTHRFIINTGQQLFMDAALVDTNLVSVNFDFFENGDIAEAFRPSIIRKTNATNEILWETTIPTENLSLQSIAVDENNIVYATARQSFQNEDGTTTNAILLALDENGQILWEKLLPPDDKTSPYVYAAFRHLNDIAISPNGGIIAVGEVGYSSDESPISEVFACKYNAMGDTLWNMNYKIANGRNLASHLLVDDKAIVAIGAGRISDIASGEKGFTLKINDLSTIIKDTMMIDTMTNISNHMLSKNTLRLYPNPAKAYLNINSDFLNHQHFDIQILDLKGQQLSSYRNIKTIPVSHLSTGQYLIRVSTSQFTFTTKWLKLPD